MEDKQSCEEIRPLLSAYYDNELLLGDSLKVNAHICSCSKCSDELNSIKKLSNLLKDFGERHPKNIPNLTKEVITRLCKENPMLCEEVLDEADNYFKGEVDLKLHYLIQEHLDSCPDCQIAYDKFEF